MKRPPEFDQFQSQTGFSSHSDVARIEVSHMQLLSFNPKRAFQVIPTMFQEQDIFQQDAFQSQTGFSSHSDGAGGVPGHLIEGVSIPNGLFKSFRRRLLKSAGTKFLYRFNPKRAFQVIPTLYHAVDAALECVVSIPNGLFKSFRQPFMLFYMPHSRCFNPKRAFQVIPTETVTKE